MTWGKGLVIVLVLAAVVWSTPAAGGACAAREDVLADLARRYGEVRVAWAVTNGNGLIEVVSADNGSWSLILTIPGGPTCLIAAGEGGWRPVNEVKEEPLA